MAEENVNEMDDILDNPEEEDILGDLSGDSEEDLMDDILDDEMESMLDDSGDLDDDLDVPEAKKEKKKAGGSSAISSVKQKLGVLFTHIPPLIKKITGSKKILIALIGGVVFFLVLIISVWFLVFSGQDENPSAVPGPGTAEMANPEGSSREPEVIFEDIIELEPFERIPMKGSSTMETVTIHMALELIDSRYRKQIYSMEDRIRKIVEDQVADVTWLEMRNPEGKIRLKYDLLKRINAAFPKPTVRNVYFTFFVMQ